MCTICGHYVKSGSIQSVDLYDMLRKMEHRGPDTHGVYLDGKTFRVEEIDELKEVLLGSSRIALGHSRLKIVGREKTSQPFRSCDGKLDLIHNGEIYNYRELRSLLQEERHRIRTGSDSEVIVHLLEESYQGDLLKALRNIVGLLDGMYVIAVTDGKTLAVARDPIGKKPLYYLENGGTVYFASEKKALWNGREYPHRLLPGDILCVDEDGYRVHKGVRVQPPQIDIIDFPEAVESYKEVLTKAIRKRLTGLTESRIGVIFSGGIDSVLVSKLLQQEGKNVVCYCTGTEDSGDIQAARAVAQDLGLELKTTIIDEKVVADILPEIIREVEESGLLQVEVAIPMYFAAKMAAADNIRVMFTGQAADELFAGYPWYTGVLEEEGYVRLHEKLWEDLNALYTDTLEREDKVTMAHSIEMRAPYLDRDVIQTAMRISPRLKIEGTEDPLRKRVHRQAAVELGVPPSLAFRIKDPAQSGSGVHDIITRVAHAEGNGADREMADENTRRDKGSLYRYGRHGERHYGDDVTRAFLRRIEKKIESEYLCSFLSTEPGEVPAGAR